MKSAAIVVTLIPETEQGRCKVSLPLCAGADEYDCSEVISAEEAYDLIERLKPFAKAPWRPQRDENVIMTLGDWDIKGRVAILYPNEVTIQTDGGVYWNGPISACKPVTP